MDSEDNMGKLENMKKYGFYFVNEDHITCNGTPVENDRENIREGKVPLVKSESLVRLNFSFYYAITSHTYYSCNR